MAHANSLANLRQGGGRTPGVPNKLNHSIKEMVEKALHKAGGVEYLTAQAHQNPVAFMGLVGRVLPLQLAGHDGGKLEVEFRWKDDSEPATVTIDAAIDVDTAPDDEPPSISFIGDC